MSHRNAVVYTPSSVRGNYPIKAVVFDLGGVVVKWSDDAMWKYVADRYHLDFKKTKRKLDNLLALPESGKTTIRRMWNIFFKSVGVSATEDYETLWVNRFEKGAKLDRKVVAMVNRLRKKYKVAAISNIESLHVKIIRKKGWLENFDFVVLSCEVKTRKPMSKIYKIALKKLGLKPRETVFIDNLRENVEGARKVGMNGIVFNNAEQLERDLKKYL